jgi:PKD repeat protein
MKRVLPIFLLVLATQTTFGRHIKGGEISYEYKGPGPNNTDRFIVTLRLFLDCAAAGAQLDNEVNIAIYQNANNQPAPGSPFTLPLTGDLFITLAHPNPCIQNPSPVCYRLRTYTLQIDLPRTASGYMAIFQRCCRIDGINNLNPNQSIGSSYVTEIHGTDAVGSGTNSSPLYVVKDTVLICQNRPFQLDFGAYDPDGDSLSYQFCDAYTCPSNPPVITNPPAPSSVGFVAYASGFSGTNPLGPSVTINPVTGLISGIAPAGGNYVVCVCVTEWRHGVRLTTHRKDFNVQIDDRCDFAAALLNPSYVNCDSLTQSFHNEAPYTPLIHSYHWDFGIPGRTDDTSNLSQPTYTFPDTGVYNVKLIINKGEDCSDSATTKMKFYPGFYPGFTHNGACKDFPFQFTDTTKAKYGTVSGWSWNFGDETTTNDTSTQKNPSWKYTNGGTKTVFFVVGSSKGCLDTVIKDIIVYDKPPITIPFRDTLICNIDTLQLFADGFGNFSWQPGYNIINANTPTPYVYPQMTTKYYVTLNDRGCVNTDSIRVRVVDHVTLIAKPDTTICLTDAITLHATGDGLRFQWTPSSTLDDVTKRDPVATPVGVSNNYSVRASIGKCNATDQITIRTVPYPTVDAGRDTTICFDDTATLHGRIIASRYSWSPTVYLKNFNTLSPKAFPLRTTQFVLSATDTLGCPKPSRDTVLVTVRPKIYAFAGNDTSIVIGQPLQLRGSGAQFFKWDPPIGLNRSDISNPIASLTGNATYVMTAFTEEGCFATDTINIKVFTTGPDIFVPNAFTPVGEANTVFRPIPVGISRLLYFRVFNRWGQLVFSTTQAGYGWDGRVAGKLQDAGSYVWMVEGVDYLGKSVKKNGTMVLIR